MLHFVPNIRHIQTLKEKNVQKSRKLRYMDCLTYP